MDGVHGLSFHGIEPDETFIYSFRVNENCTYCYHSHSGLQGQEGITARLSLFPLSLSRLCMTRNMWLC
ncbi:multicopper oxidase domain-containing protein [Enterobacter kobei]